MATFDGTLSNSMRLEGCDYLVSSLMALPVAIRTKHLKPAIEKALPPMRAALLANTPQGPTGNLRAAVGSEAIYYKSGVAFGIVGYRRAVSVTGQLGYHSHLIEFGTNDRVPTRGPFLSSFKMAQATGWRPPYWSGEKTWPMVARHIRGSRPQHPLGRAYSATANQCRDILIREMQSGLEKGLAEVARKGL
jgi:HK97 gp10 family phage protein